MPFLTEGLLDEPIVPLQLGALTYFLPYIGYYVLGWATWSAPPRRRVAWWLLLVAVPLLIASTVWAYASPVTEIPPGKVLLPTYLAPTVMPLSLALVISVLSLGRTWRVGERTEHMLRRVGVATFGVFLVHFAVLMLLRELGFPESSMPAGSALIVVATLGALALPAVGEKVALGREVPRGAPGARDSAHHRGAPARGGVAGELDAGGDRADRRGDARVGGPHRGRPEDPPRARGALTLAAPRRLAAP